MRSNEDWKIAVKAKIDEVLANATAAEYPPPASLPATIDHTLLKPDATPAQINTLCDEAIKYGFKSCCVNGSYIPQVAERLQGTRAIPCVVVGFPLGAMKPSAKAFEAQEAVRDGAKEVDMVLHIGHLKSQDYVCLHADVEAVVRACSPIPVKVILETVFLTDEEKIAASFVAAEAGAAFVKTCTGFAGGAASPGDVALMKRTVSYKDGAVRVKASAGVRTYEKCLEVIKAGADRVGTSSGVAIMKKSDLVPGSH
ncbi:unnamed protein product [Tuber melanosporum]|jgi:deoxyribose-phosphate aldolase|uniref:deoxyribose-phosphate aldolase n=1 Tax=Tuber melanosporum (strain Mel28) TaxID=656061 RepID=D5GCL7_TUBMM|nr:uncharacterized protein GSTUM_00000719001 [Tuber melanosporum]CAZ82260.1 unnamed protein product [Tuber melanosporum]